MWCCDEFSEQSGRGYLDSKPRKNSAQKLCWWWTRYIAAFSPRILKILSINKSCIIQISKSNPTMLTLNYQFWLGCFQLFSHPLTFNFPRSFDCIRKLAFGSPLGNCFTPVLCAANRWCPEISNLHKHRPLWVPIHTLVEWSLWDSFLVPV